MMVFKRKQIVVLSLVLLIVVAGYLQYSYKKSSSTPTSDSETGKLGEAVYVDNEGVAADDKNTDKAKEKKASKFANDYFANAKLDRDMIRSKSTSSLKGIAEDANATKDERSLAYEEMIRLTKNGEKEMRIETLIKREGYSDVLVLFGDDGSVDIEVKSPTMTQQQAAKITDIVTRQADLKISPTDLHIKNIY